MKRKLTEKQKAALARGRAKNKKYRPGRKTVSASGRSSTQRRVKFLGLF